MLVRELLGNSVPVDFYLLWWLWACYSYLLIYLSIELLLDSRYIGNSLRNNMVILGKCKKFCLELLIAFNRTISWKKENWFQLIRRKFRNLHVLTRTSNKNNQNWKNLFFYSIFQENRYRGILKITSSTIVGEWYLSSNKL